MSLPTAHRERIAELLSHRVPQVRIAAAVGITPGRLSQIIEEDTELHGLLTQADAKKVDQEVRRGKAYDNIEGMMIRRMPEMVQECTSLGEMTRSLAILQDIRNKEAGYALPGDSTGIGTGVQINLSDVAKAQINIVIGPNKSIIELAGRNVHPMTRHNAEDYLRNDHPALPAESPLSYEPEILPI